MPSARVSMPIRRKNSWMALVKAGWLRKTTTQTDGRPKHRWEVNPKLFASNAESAESAESTEEAGLPAVPAVPAEPRGGQEPANEMRIEHKHSSPPKRLLQ